MTWRLTIPPWEGRVEAKATVKTKAKLKMEAKVNHNDVATDNCLVGGWGEDKGNGEDERKAEGGSEGQ